MADMKIACMVLGMIGTNVYLAWNEETKHGWIVDPADAPEKIIAQLTQEGITADAILLTHGHFDHISAVNALKEQLSIPVYAMAAEEALLNDPSMNVSARYGDPVSVTADHLLEDGEELTVADLKIKAIHTPGHTGGGCCYYVEGHGILFSGDTLFRCSVGRSDLPTGNGSVLVESVRDKLMLLPDEVAVLPGHGGTSSIGYERSHNPFL